MNKLDRALQLALLKDLGCHYPKMVRADKMRSHGEDYETYIANMAYLYEHGLIDVNWFKRATGELSAVMEAKLTHKGCDFLSTDGRLMAILGVVTVRFHGDTLKDVIAAQIQAATLAPEDKRRYLDQLQSLPAETTKHLVLKLVDAGLANWQKALPLLQSILS